MRIGWRHLIGTIIAIAVIAPLVAWSGVIGIGASSGHWKVTDWFLHWAMRSSVRTAALGTEVPPLNPAAVPMAAAHFETACAMCHGSPASARPSAVQKMLPPPPDLGPVINTWTDAELFQIVQHGVRFTGMPAWPVQTREDEVWALVAFLRRYPDLGAQEYRNMAGTPKPASASLYETIRYCDTCHASNVASADNIVPKLEGQSSRYLIDALTAYANGSRPSGIMQVAAQNLSDDMRVQIAEHYTRQPRLQNTQANMAENDIAIRGNAHKDIPACLTCHDKQGANPAYPILSGQSQPYLANQLRLFASGERGGGEYHKLMLTAAKNLDEAEIEALAEYFAKRSR